MEIVTCLSMIFSFLAAAAGVSLLVKSYRSAGNDRMIEVLRDELRDARSEQRELFRDGLEHMTESAAHDKAQYYEAQDARLRALMLSESKMAEETYRMLSAQNERLAELTRATEARMEAFRTMIDTRMSELKRDTDKNMEEMRKTVDEKLQETLESRISQSFRLVSERLEQVYRGLGEMQTLASGVGDLKKVLTNVKTKGILGELQLGAILEEVLSPEQYETNVATVPGSRERVEYAIRLPGSGDGTVLLPIDAKFPAEPYRVLEEAYAEGDSAKIAAATQMLLARLRASAKEIHTKYVQPPHTTDFAVMFLPFEGLYAEAVRHGMVEILQRESKINLAGPSTMAALLSSLQLGFRNLAIQKRSAEVWDVLLSVKSEFEKFGDVLALTDQRLTQAQDELNKLIGTRTRMIQRRLDRLAAPGEEEKPGLGMK